MAIRAHDMNAARGRPQYVTIQVAPQTPVELPVLRSVSGAAGATSQLLSLASLPAPGDQRSASFDAADLIRNGGDFDPGLPSQLLTPDGVDPTVGEYACATEPFDPDFGQTAYGIYSFTLEDYATSDQPQSIGALWQTDSSPNRYFIGLSNWQSAHWEWFECGPANVVTVASMAPYVRAGDNSTFVAVVVMDSSARDLVLLQVGADEVRGLGGMVPETEAGLTQYGPEDYFPGKASSSLPGSCELDPDLLGQVYDQQQTLMCTACASATMMNYELSRAYAPYWRPLNSATLDPNPRRSLSPKWLYQQTLLGVSFTGRPADWVFELMRLSGANTQSQVPWNMNLDFDYDVPASYAEASYLRVSSWRRIGCTGQVAIDEIRNQLANLDHPVLFSFTVNPVLQAWRPASSDTVFHWDSSLPSVLLSHSVVITGYDDTLQAFHVRNSWGSGWGSGGYFWLGYDNLTSGPAIYGAFVMSVSYSAATAEHFTLTQDAAVPPSDLSCSNAFAAITLNWTPVIGATGYRIYRDSLDNQIAVIHEGTTATYADEGVTDFHSHTYFVRTIVGPSTSIGRSQARGWRPRPQSPRVLSVGQLRLGVLGTQMRFYPVVENPDPTAPLTYSWNFPMASIVENPHSTEHRPLVTLNVPGTYQGSVQVDNAGGSQSRAFTYTVYGASSSPQATFTVPPAIARNMVVRFDAAGSIAEQGSKVDRYLWDWNKDGFSDYESHLPVLDHIFTEAGTAKLGLMVHDDRGLPSDWHVQSFTVTP